MKMDRKQENLLIFFKIGTIKTGLPQQTKPKSDGIYSNQGPQNLANQSRRGDIFVGANEREVNPEH